MDITGSASRGEGVSTHQTKRKKQLPRNLRPRRVWRFCRRSTPPTYWQRPWHERPEYGLRDVLEAEERCRGRYSKAELDHAEQVNMNRAERRRRPVCLSYLIIGAVETCMWKAMHTPSRHDRRDHETAVPLDCIVGMVSALADEYPELVSRKTASRGAIAAAMQMCYFLPRSPFRRIRVGQQGRFCSAYGVRPYSRLPQWLSSKVSRINWVPETEMRSLVAGAKRVAFLAKGIAVQHGLEIATKYLKKSLTCSLSMGYLLNDPLAFPYGRGGTVPPLGRWRREEEWGKPWRICETRGEAA